MKYLILFFLIALVSCKMTKRRSPVVGCLDKKVEGFVKIVEQNNQIFVETKNIQIDYLKENIILPSQDCIEFLDSLNAKPNWSLSFFGDRKYAGYKTQYSKSIDLWSAAYLGEYEFHSKQLILFPLKPKQYSKQKLNY